LDFNFGKSTIVQLCDLPARINEAFIALKAEADVIVLFGHSLQGDLKWLEEAGVELDNIVECDLAEVWMARHNHIQKTGLMAMLTQLQFSFTNLHNGGNDATYTLEVGMAMMEKEEIHQAKGQAAVDGSLL
jgi:hypothetical protein